MTTTEDPVEAIPLTKEQELAAAQQAAAGSVPLIPEVLDTTFLVQRGLGSQNQPSFEADDRVVEVRELTGADEEILARQKTQLDFYATAVALGVVRIGTQTLSSMPLADRRVITSNLLLGDRDLCFLAVARVTFGNEKVLPFKCPSCEQEQEAGLLLDTDFPQKELDSAATSFKYQSASHGEIEYRLANGRDQDEIVATPGITTAESNTQMLARCIVKVGGQLVKDPLAFSRSLGMRDRGALIEGITAAQPSIDMTLHTVCTACGEEVPLALGWGDIFRP